MKIDDLGHPGQLVDPETGLVSRRIFTDPDIHCLELTRVFARSWLFVGHDSELPKPGDYLRRVIGDDPVILARGQDGTLRVFLNACPHRGALLCRADAGNAMGYVCPYHGWSFDNAGQLTAMADAPEAYKGRVDLSTFNLVQARVGVHAGLIFATFDPQAPSLDEYLGDARWYIDMLFARTPGGAQALGAPVRWVAQKNWKYGAVNFAADGPHALKTHGPITRKIAAGMPLEVLRTVALEGPAVRAGNGHGCIFVDLPPGMPPWVGFHPDMVGLYQKTLTPGQLKLKSNMFNKVMTIFPNLSWVHFPISFAPDQPPVNFFNVRVWQPTGPDRTEIWNWFFADREAPDEYKQASLEAGIRTFTAAGTFDQDDAEAWAAIDAGSRGTIGRERMSSFQMILASHDERIADFPGPGEAYRSTYSEMSEFGLLLRWRELMAG